MAVIQATRSRLIHSTCKPLLTLETDNAYSLSGDYHQALEGFCLEENPIDVCIKRHLPHNLTNCKAILVECLNRAIEQLSFHKYFVTAVSFLLYNRLTRNKSIWTFCDHANAE